MPEDASRSPVLSRRTFSVGALSLSAALAARSFASTPSAQPAALSDVDWLEDQARRVVASSLLRAGETRGAFVNSTAFDLHVPGGNMGYPAFWVRDAAMMLGADLISAAEIRGWITLIARTIRSADWHVRDGVVVPAYFVPDHINFDGSACFYPGSYESGDKQGGPPWGKFPPLDDNFYFIDMVYQHWRLTQDRSFLRGTIQTAFGELPLIDLCDSVFRAVRTSPVADLVTTSEIDNAKDWGFCDAVTKSGSLLFPSILRSIAAHHLSKLFTALGDEDRAKLSHLQSASASFGINMTFLTPPHRTDNSAAVSEAWLHSATEVGNQPDVWGSAFALATRVIQGEHAVRVSRALVRAYRDKTAVRDGLVRHILTTDTKSNAGWHKSISPVGEYQNGGYWSTPSGWYIAAMHTTDPAAARDMARDLVRTLRSWTRGDGTTRAWEWSNPDTGRQANDLYAASVALPWITLTNARLLHLLRQS